MKTSAGIQILGMILLVLGAQGAIRLLVNPADAGLLGWLPGGFGVQLALYAVGLVIGIILLASSRRSPRST